MEKRHLARLLRQFSDLVENISDEDIQALVAGRKRIALVPVASRIAAGKGPRIAPDMSVLAADLRSAKTREDGEKLLAARGLTKGQLEALARAFDLHVSKEDTTERLRQKIIQASIGALLASQAVRGG